MTLRTVRHRRQSAAAENRFRHVPRQLGSQATSITQLDGRGMTACGALLRHSKIAGVSGRAADIAAVTEFDPSSGLREHSRDLPIGLQSETARRKSGIIPPLHE